MYYNIYDPFIENEKITIVPHVDFPTESGDKTYLWNKDRDRMDVISQKYYGTPYGGTLIMFANATLGTNEDEIPDGSIILIPFPYKSAVQRYIDIMEKFKSYY
jgi:hypothetical protein